MAFDTTSDPTSKPASVPTTGAAGWQQSQNAFNTGYSALGNQQKIAGQTGDVWSGIAAAQHAQDQQGLDALKRQAAATLYSNRGSLGGGGGLAAAQQNNAALGQTVGQYTSQANAQAAQTAQAAQQAQLGAQGQIAQAAGNQYKMIQDQQQRQTRVNQALDSARSILSRYSGTIFTTSTDKQKAANAIQQEVLATETDPAVIAAVQNYTQGLLNGSVQSPGSINT